MTTPLSTPPSTPRDLGLRWPAEWESHEATWLSWPKNVETWPGAHLSRVEEAFVSMVAALLPGERVRINVDHEAAEARVRGLLAAGGVDADRGVEFFHIPTDDAWVRDHGPLFLLHSERADAAVVDFDFDAWGGKYPPWTRDDAVPRQVARALGLPRYPAGFTLEPGSIEGDGRGTVLTTEACLLNPNRGPGGVARSRPEMEAKLGDWLGAERVLWLGDGIEGDDTDGHVDDLTRFVSESVIVTAVADDPSHPDHAALAANLTRLRGFRDGRGAAYTIVPLPVPPAVREGGAPLPASYANFYIANEVVLMPSFDAPQDARAAAILAECLPGRRVVGIPSRSLVVGLGALHCLTQQQPAVTSREAARDPAG